MDFLHEKLIHNILLLSVIPRSTPSYKKRLGGSAVAKWNGNNQYSNNQYGNDKNGNNGSRHVMTYLLTSRISCQVLSEMISKFISSDAF